MKSTLESQAQVGYLPDESWLLLNEILQNVQTKGISALSALEGGGVVAAFETAFAELAGTRFALSVSSGAAALHTALLACDVGSGDEVIVSPYGWGQTVGAVLAVGATPVFADIDPNTGNLDPGMARQQITESTKAILVTHTHGLPAEMQELGEISRAAGIWLLADAAQAVGAIYAGRPVGALADISCFSLGRGKVITTGEGGVLATSNVDLLERMLLVSQHPQRSFREIEDRVLFNSITELGQSYRFTPIAAAIGLGQISKVGSIIERKRHFASRLSTKLKTIPGLVLPDDCLLAKHSFHSYVLRSIQESRDVLERTLAGEGFEIKPISIRSPIYLRAPFNRAMDQWFPKANLRRKPHPSWIEGSCPGAERRCFVEDIYLVHN